MKRSRTTLESLEWFTCDIGRHRISPCPVGEEPFFPRLKRLAFETSFRYDYHTSLSDYTVWAILNGSPRLTHLKLRVMQNPELLLGDVNGPPLHLRNLKSLHLTRGVFFDKRDALLYMHWIRTHHALEHLTIDAAAYNILNKIIVPKLINIPFFSLISLTLHWTRGLGQHQFPVEENQHARISDFSLGLLGAGRLATLIHLSIGPDRAVFALENNIRWQVDRELVRGLGSGLPRLETLIFHNPFPTIPELVDELVDEEANDNNEGGDTTGDSADTIVGSETSEASDGDNAASWSAYGTVFPALKSIYWGQFLVWGEPSEFLPRDSFE